MVDELDLGTASDVMPNELQQTLGDRMRKSMEYAGLTIPDMALWLGVHRNSVSSYLNDRTSPGSPILRLWSIKCGVPLEWIQSGGWPEAAKPAVKRAARKVLRRTWRQGFIVLG